MRIGYEQLIAAAASLTGTKLLDADTVPSDRDTAEFLNAFEALLPLVATTPGSEMRTSRDLVRNAS